MKSTYTTKTTADYYEISTNPAHTLYFIRILYYSIINIHIRYRLLKYIDSSNFHALMYLCNGTDTLAETIIYLKIQKTLSTSGLSGTRTDYTAAAD